MSFDLEVYEKIQEDTKPEYREINFNEIAGAILYNTIDVASLIGVYGPAKNPLPGS